jgi:hypothetical protein
MAASCATTTKLDSTRKVDVSKGFAYSFKQDDKTISDLVDRLKEHPAAAPKLQGIDAKAWGAAGLLIVGSTLVLVNSADNLRKTMDQADNPLQKSKTSYTLSLVGAGVMLASLPLSIMANRQLGEAVEVYNAGFTAKEAAPQSLLPATVLYLATVEDAARRRQCVAGLSGRF